jgi:hypothetical protein
MEEPAKVVQEEELDMAKELGADPNFSIQCFTLYVPNKDKDDREIGNQRRWVLDAIRLLSELNGGATSLPAEGGWLSDEGKIILEHPVIVYSNVKQPTEFRRNLPRLREFLHRMGRETNQGEIAFEFDNAFFRIRIFDPA